MATTTNNSWTIPADTDLVRNGASAIRTLGNGIDATIGKWQGYAVTLSGTGWAIGNGSVVGRYQQIANMVNFECEVTIGSTTSKGTAALSLNIPVAASTQVTANVVPGLFLDASASAYYPLYARLTSTECRPYVVGSGALSSVTSTSPVTVATGDVITISGSYAI